MNDHIKQDILNDLRPIREHFTEMAKETKFKGLTRFFASRSQIEFMRNARGLYENEVSRVASIEKLVEAGKMSIAFKRLNSIKYPSAEMDKYATSALAKLKSTL